MTRLLLATVCVSAFVVSSDFSDQTRLANRQWMYGVGETETCGTWRANRASLPGAGDHSNVDAWIVGFVSGAGLSSGSPPPPPHTLTIDGILEAVDRECAQDPSAKVADATAKAFLVRLSQK